MNHKKLIPYSVCGALALLGLVSSASALDQVSTDVYGVMTLHVAGGGSPSVPRLSMISPGFFQPAEWQGAVQAVSGKRITVEATWEPDQFNGAAGRYFVEVAGGVHAGAWSDIVATASGSITTAKDLSASLTPGTALKIRRHLLLDELLCPVNEVRLKGATSVLNADEVVVYEGANPTVYWRLEHPTNSGLSGWYNANAVRANSVVIAPHQGIIIRRKVAAPAVLFSAGAVKSGPTRIPIVAGMNVVPMVASEGVTLGSSGLYTGDPATGLQGSTSALRADLVTLYGGAGQTSYWYLQHPTNAALSGWYDANAKPANDVLIAPGTSFLIERKAEALEWTAVPSSQPF